MNEAIDLKNLAASLTKQQIEDLLRAKQATEESDRSAYKRLSAEALTKAIARLQSVSTELALAKKSVFSEFESIVALKRDIYGIDAKQQTHTFSTDTGGLTIGYRVNEGWDDTVHEGIAKVLSFIESLARDDNSAALVKTVLNLLKKDQKGNLRASRVIELERLQDVFRSATFNDGVSIIKKAYRPVKSCWFIEAWVVVKKSGDKINIPLSISAVDFPSGYVFKGFAASEEK